MPTLLKSRPASRDPYAVKGTQVGNGLVVVLNNTQLDQRRTAGELMQRQAQRDEVPRCAMAGYVMSCFQKSEEAHRDAHQRIVNARRQRKGDYDDTKLAQIEAAGQQPIFAMITEVKSAAAEAWLSDIIGVQPWRLEPTKIPELPDWIKQGIVNTTVQRFIQDQSQGRIPSDVQSLDREQQMQIVAMVKQYAQVLRENTELAYRKEAQRRAGLMQTVIEDQLEESDWKPTLDDLITDLVTDGVLICRGPVVRSNPRFSYAGPLGLQVMEIPMPETDRVDPLDVFPEPSAVDVDDGWIIERFQISPEKLSAYRGQSRQGVVESELTLCLEALSLSGGFQETDDLQDQRATIADKRLEDYRGLITGYRYTGPVMTALAEQLGFRGKDRLGYTNVCCEVVAGRVVKLKANWDPLGRSGYSKSVYEKIPGSFWGLGVPMLMEDIQDMCNASVRALGLNMALCAGPQTVYTDIERMPIDDKITSLYPLKVHQFTKKPGDNTEPLSFVQIESRAAELISIFQTFLRMADERTRIPAYAYGSDQTAGAGKTASGLSMLMDASSRGIKKIIERLDTRLFTTVIERFWTFNMLFHPDAEIKGDVKIVVKGTLEQFLKQQKQQLVLNLLQATNNPVDLEILGLSRRAKMLRSVFAAHDMTDEGFVPTEQEINQYIEAKAKQEQAVLAAQMQQQQMLQRQQAQQQAATAEK